MGLWFDRLWNPCCCTGLGRLGHLSVLRGQVSVLSGWNLVRCFVPRAVTRGLGVEPADVVLQRLWPRPRVLLASSLPRIGPQRPVRPCPEGPVRRIAYPVGSAPKSTASRAIMPLQIGIRRCLSVATSSIPKTRPCAAPGVSAGCPLVSSPRPLSTTEVMLRCHHSERLGTEAPVFPCRHHASDCECGARRLLALLAHGVRSTWGAARSRSLSRREASVLAQSPALRGALATWFEGVPEGAVLERYS